MTDKKNVTLVDETRYPQQPIDTTWSSRTEATAADLLLRFHRAMRNHDQAISVDDEMWNGLGKEQADYARLHYMYGGRSALKNVIDALTTANARIPSSILDFPSSHGRVTRFLKAAFPESEVWAADINIDGVDFCASQFGALPFYSSPDLNEVVLPKKFDMIWCGSLASHLPEPQCKALFKLLIGALEPDGILCITTCGRGMQYAHEHVFKTIHEEAYQEICRQLAIDGFGYAGYNYRYGTYEAPENYGMTFIYPAWIERNILSPDIQVLLFREKAWHGSQDVWCFIKRPVSSWYDWGQA